MLAFVIDAAIVGLVALLLITTVGSAVGRVIGEDGFYQLFLFAFFPIGLLLVYFAVSEYLSDGRTIGKRTLGLRTIRIDGAPPTFEAFGLRAAMLMLDFATSAGAIGILAMGSSPNRQRVGDRIAQTVVIHARTKSLYELKDILNIKTLDDHVVKYPDATKLTVGQALAIKEVIVRWELERSEAVAQAVKLAVEGVGELLGIERVRGGEQIDVLRQVLRDYIVLTR